jgi:hypothetical protein
MKPLLGLCTIVCLVCGCFPHRTIELGDFRAPADDKAGGRVVIKDRPIVMHFQEGEHDFDALIGATFQRGEYAKAFIRNSFTQIYVDNGYVYMAGTYPFVQSNIVATIADGTVYALQVDGSTQRVYLLSTGRRDAVKISLEKGIPSLPGATKKLRLENQHFATIAPDAAGNYSIIDSGPILGNNAVAPFIKELHDAVQAAGLLPTWPSNLP